MNASEEFAYTGKKPYETLAALDVEPYQAFLDLYIGNWSLLKVPPRYLQSFEVTRVSEGSNTFTFTLFDKYWDEIEETLSLGYMNVTFRYGHLSGRQSRMFIGVATDYSIEFTTSGVVLTVNGTSCGLRQNLQKMTAQVTGSPDEAFTAIANKVGWKLGRIDPAFTIQDHSSFDVGQKAPKEYNLLNANPAKYIQQELVPRAVRASDGRGGYQFYLDDSTSPPTANFHPIDIDPNIERTYVYHKGINTNVYSFTTEFKGVFVGSGDDNGTTVESDSSDPVTKEESTSTYTAGTNPNQVYTGNATPLTPDATKVTLDSTGMNDEEMSAIVNYRWNTNSSKSYGATLEIIGDPTLEVTETIRLIVLTQSGQLHHTSGVYQIMSIKDSIEGGVLRTSLTLTRNADLEAGAEIVKYGVIKK